jgi:hypothetical protein
VSETVFKKVDYQLSNLVDDIELGEIGLPDIQRPFVWEPAKVRDLFDSMYRGYPVGHLLFWESGAEPGARQIGALAKQLAPKLLIVDGQQRLTSLFAVMKRRDIVGKDYAQKRIRIAFRPRDETFTVADAATVRDPAYLQDIGEIWAEPAYTVITRFLARLEEAGALEPGDREQIPNALTRLDGLRTYPFTALVLGAEIDEEKVAEVFVRINSKGKNLNQADFILTLMSVFWEEGRQQLEAWSRDARAPGRPAWNPFLLPEPDQLLRVSIALGFRRGRLEDAYTMLRGRDPKSGKISPGLREQQLNRLAEAQARVLDAPVWKEFLQSLLRSGHRSSATISSNLAIVYTYALYLIGKYDYQVPFKELRDVIARWFFMSSLTARYSASPETRVAADLAALPATDSPAAFTAHLDSVIAQRLTNDYWEITLPDELATSAARSPALFGYLSALDVLHAQVLFSKMRCRELLDPALAGGQPKLQRHHLWPRKFLEELGIVDLKQVNQIANLTPLEWHDNLAISAHDPEHYWPKYLHAMRGASNGLAPFTEAEIDQMLRYHALPADWPTMKYDDFLVERRRRMAAVVREAFDSLQYGTPEVDGRAWPPSEPVIQHMLREGESGRIEMKSSLRADTRSRGIPPKVLEKVVARTIAGFMNSAGGTLIIGVDDAGVPLGLDKDIATLQRRDLDGLQQTLVQVIDRYLEADKAANVQIYLAKVGPEQRDIILVRCPAYHSPVFLTDSDGKEFHVRAGNTTRLLDVEEATSYIAHHWKQKPAVAQSRPVAAVSA